MSYNVNYTDSRKTAIQVDPDTQLNTLPVKLFGRAFLEYGEQLNETFLSLLENFSIEQAPGVSPPEPLLTDVSTARLGSPVEGQTWHNKTDDSMYFYDGQRWIRLGSRNDIGANWGQVLNGEQIPRPVSPDGYVFPYSECIWSVSPASYLENFTNMVCYTDSQARVNMRYDRESTGDRVLGVANYLIIGIKGNTNTGVSVTAIEPSLTPTPTPATTPTPTPTAIAQGIVWLSTQSGQLGTYVRSTGIYTPFASATPNIYTDLAYDGVDLYGVSYVFGTGTLLWRISPTTGVATLVASNVGSNLSTSQLNITALCTGPGGDLYAMSSGSTQLFRLNKVNGSLTVVTDLGIANTGDIVYDQPTQRFYITASNGSLRSYSLINGSVSTVGALVDTATSTAIPPVFGLVAQNGSLYGYCSDNGREYNISKTDARSALLRQVADTSTGQFYNFIGAAFAEEGSIPPIASPQPSLSPTPTPTPTPSTQGCSVLVSNLDSQLFSGSAYSISVQSNPSSNMRLQFSPSGYTVDFTTGPSGFGSVVFIAPTVGATPQTFSVQVINLTVNNCSTFNTQVVINPASPTVSPTPTLSPSPSPTPTPTPTPSPLSISFFNSALGENSAFSGFNASCSFSSVGSSSTTGLNCISAATTSCGSFSCAPVSSTPLGIRVSGGTPPYTVRMTSNGQTGASGLLSGDCFAIGSAGPISSATTADQQFTIGTISTNGGTITGISMIGSCGSQNTAKTGALNFVVTDAAGQTASRGTSWGFSRDGSLEANLISYPLLTRDFYSGTNLSSFYGLGLTITGLTSVLIPGSAGARLSVAPVAYGTPLAGGNVSLPVRNWIETGPILGDEPVEWGTNYWARLVPVGAQTGIVSGTPNQWFQVGTGSNSLIYEANVGTGLGNVNVHSVRIGVDVVYSAGGPPSAGISGTRVLTVELSARPGNAP